MFLYVERIKSTPQHKFPLIMLRLSIFQYASYRYHLMAAMIMCSITLSAQHPISKALFQLMDAGNFREAQEAISNYSVSELSALPDSVLFDYYYLKAAIKGNDGDEDNKRAYLIEAKKLCEKSQGIHSPVYLELCWAIGNSFENAGDTLSAFEVYQAALIQSIGLYSLSDEDVKWQYEEINNKVIDWYRDDNLRRRMVNHRENLAPRDVSKDAVQNDLEFYYQFYKDPIAKKKLEEADSLYSLSQWENAGQLYLEIGEATDDNPIAKATLQELATICLINVEDFQKAEELLLSNLTLLNNYKYTKEYRRTLSQLSNLYNAIHNYSKAKEFASEAKYRYEDALDFSRGYILCLHRCAKLERGNENYFLALLLEDVALQELYRNKTFGVLSGKPTSREFFLADCLSSAAVHYNQVGFRDQAYLNLEKAIEIAIANNLDTSTYYSNLADLYIASRDFGKAVVAKQEAYNLSKSEYNKIEIGTGLGLAQFLAQQPISTKVVKETSNYLISLLSSTFAFSTTNERRNFWSYFEYYFPLLNFLAYQTDNPVLYIQIYNNILIEKGLLLRTANNLRDEIISEGKSEDISLYDQLLQLRLLLQSISQKEAEIVKKKIEEIDKYLTKEYSSYVNYVNSNGITWQDVRRNLQEEDIAIEFYNIPETKWHEDESDVDGKYRYCAITLRKEYGYPHIIPLFTDERLLELDKEDLYETDSIYNLIWKPLESELKGVKSIYFAADRDLHKIGIEYAPLPGGGIIGDKFNLYRISSTRVLAEKKKESRCDNAVLYGGLRYDVGKDDLIAESRAGDYHPTSTSRAFTAADSRYGVKYLPGTLKEVEDISQNFSNMPRLITDISGTEESFKSLAGSSIDIIHLATHGFFWSEDDARKRDYVTFLNPGNRAEQSEEDKALTRSGLFFSGANIGLQGETLPNDVEDGVLTALELSNMNLGHVDMVVMSACESGLGETSGEGVFGLQRGFKLAGANTLLMSLWKVDDTATQLLMTEFYRHYLSGKTKQESLRLAQQSLRDNANYSDPTYWAAFILLDGLN